MVVRESGYASNKTGDNVTLQKLSVLIQKKDGIYNTENMD